jgi:uncharacterized protein (TIGR03435 family)
MRKLGGFVAVLSAIAFGQTPPSRPSFEVAGIQPSSHVANPGIRGGSVRGGRYELKDASLLDLIVTAYGVERDRVQGGPAWLDSDRFDIAAKAPADATPQTINLMLQSLLAGRFKLVLHQDSWPLPVYSLKVGKGKLKLKEAAGSVQPGCQAKPRQPGADNAYNQTACRNVTMEAFAAFLREMETPGGLLPNPVVDSTGLKGVWDFDLRWSSRRQRALNGSDAIRLADAIGKQLGLKLELGTTLFPVTVVDSVNRKPTDDPPDLAAKLPPAPPAVFEVVEVRPSRPDETLEYNFENGRLDAQGIPLKEMIKAGWDIDNDELIAGAPKFTETARYDVVAKTSTDPAIAAQTDDETLTLMVRAFLVERFKLVTHMEERAVSSYVLSTAKPKLHKADPSNRTGCAEGPGADGKDPRVANPMLNRLLTCRNMTMAQFAEQLPNLVSGYVQNQVLDETKLEGAFDFTFAFSGVNIFRNALTGRGPAAGAAAEPNGALSLSEALDKQLGIKLELRKRNAQVLVVDHVEEKPVE